MTEAIPQEAMAYDQLGIAWSGGEQAGIMSMRWENKEMFLELYRNLTYAVQRTYGGKPYLIPGNKAGNEQLKPPINMIGARAIVTMIQSVVNPNVVLSKISEQEANALYERIEVTVEDLLTDNQDRYECKGYTNMAYIRTVVQNICFPQLRRPVGGHESIQTRTNLQERRGEETYTMSDKSRGILPWRKGENQP